MFVARTRGQRAAEARHASEDADANGFATVSDETSLERARVVATREGIDVPVMRAGALVGLLRSRDVERLGASTVPSVAAHDWAWREEELTVEAVLSRDRVSLAPDASVHEAARLLDEGDLDAVPIVDSSAASASSRRVTSSGC